MTRYTATSVVGRESINWQTKIYMWYISAKIWTAFWNMSYKNWKYQTNHGMYHTYILINRVYDSIMVILLKHSIFMTAASFFIPSWLFLCNLGVIWQEACRGLPLRRLDLTLSSPQPLKSLIESTCVLVGTKWKIKGQIWSLGNILASTWAWLITARYLYNHTGKTILINLN